MAVKEYLDFSGGVNRDLPPQKQSDKMLSDSLNFTWNAGLKKRRGYADVYDHVSGAIVGHLFVIMNSVNVTIIAVRTTTTTRFYSNYSGTMTEINASFTFTGASVTVRMDDSNERVICVDRSGVNMPLIIYYSGGMVIETLNTHDTRTVEDSFWFAGFFDSSESDGDQYVDDTTDAQDVGANDFVLANTTAGDGFWISANQKFSQVTLNGATQMTGSPVAVWEYWNGTAWSTLTVSGITFTAAEADRVGTFTVPTDWALFELYDGVVGAVTSPGSMFGNYAIRCRFTTAPGAESTCDSIEVEMTQAVTLATSGEYPTDVCVHNSRFWLTYGNAASYSNFGVATGWEPEKAEYFSDGGSSIIRPISMGTYLAIVKEQAILGLYGTDSSTFIIKKLADEGTTNGDSCSVASGMLFYEDTGKIMIFGGSAPLEIGKHIRSIITTGGVGVTYKGNYWYISSDKILVTDPDQIVKDQNGDGIGSFWPLDINTSETILPVVYGDGNQFSNANIYNRLVVAQGYELKCLDYGDHYYDDTATPIDCYVETKPYVLDTMGQNKIITRVKSLITMSGTWQLTIYGHWGEEQVDIPIASGAGGGHFTHDDSVPYTLDSESYAFKLENETVNNCTIYGFSCEVNKRRF